MLKNKAEYSEAELFEGVKQKETAVLRHLYQTMTPIVYRDVMNNSGTEEEAKDLFQETIVVVIQNIRDEKYQSQNLKGYIKNVARHLWYKKLRSRGREVELQEQQCERKDDLTYEHYLELLSYEEKIGKLREGLQQLEEPCHSILVRFYYEKQSLQAIAEAFNWSYQYCKKRIHQCRQCLKRLL